MKQIELFGQTVNIGMNMSTQIAYEVMTEQPFSLQEIINGRGREMIALYFASIFANNPGTDITIDMLMNDATHADLTVISNAMSEEIRRFYQVPAFAKKEDPEHDDEKNV